jgi:cyclopropane fatty-acyl-phospholipid synthase-like methyltransferase
MHAFSSNNPQSTANRPDAAGVRAYYDETYWDYRLFWFAHGTCAMHFGYWDDSVHTHAQSLLNMNRQLARRVGVRAGHRVLDAGCGFGDTCIWLAQEVDAVVVGITLVPQQVTFAGKYAKATGVSCKTVFHLQDYTSTSFPDASYDAVIALESACHAPDKRLFLSEAYRLLKPGGRLGIIEYMQTDAHLSPHDETLLSEWCRGWAMPNLGTKAQWERWTRELGYTDIVMEDITSHIVPSIRRLYRIGVLWWPFARLGHQLGALTDIQFGNKVAVQMGFHALRRRLWSEVALTASKPT